MHENSILKRLPEKDGALVLPLGNIRVQHPLSTSAITEAYMAFREGLDVPCVLRVMKPEFTAQLGEKMLNDLLKGCQHYARIRHQNLAAIYDVGIWNGYRYAVNEYVTGIPLSDRIKDRPLTEPEALQLMTPIAEGLATLWRNDFLHRGVSPLRVLVTSEGIPKLDVVILPRTSLDPMLIEAHAPFMAGFWPPEELRQSLEIDPRSDMFSFGASLYYAVTGVSPFGKGSRTELIARTMTEAPVHPQILNPILHPALCAFVMRCLHRNPKDRFDSTRTFMEELHALHDQISCNASASSCFCQLVPEETTSSTSTFRMGDIIGQCKLEKMVGSGAFGVVYKARHKLLDMPVAVKFLPVELAEKNPEYVDLFLREARTAIRIRHKHVIGIYEAGQERGQYYLMMEFAPGGSVLDRLELFQGTLPEKEVLQILRETALGLGAAEEMNIVHRDIKPANLMYGAQNEIKIADLGLAKRLPRPAAGKAQVTPSIRAEQLTMLRGDNMIQGTPAYMAPEMATTPERVDIRSDLYSLGATAYHLITGQLPFDGDDPMTILMKHATQPVVRLRDHAGGISAALEDVVLRLLEKNPDDRYQSPTELVGAISSMNG